jgi:hypothetical protein
VGQELGRGTWRSTGQTVGEKGQERTLLTEKEGCSCFFRLENRAHHEVFSVCTSSPSKEGVMSQVVDCRCYCSCHHEGLRVKHVFPCCAPCPDCGANIKHGCMGEHQAECWVRKGRENLIALREGS